MFLAVAVVAPPGIITWAIYLHKYSTRKCNESTDFVKITKSFGWQRKLFTINLMVYIL